MEQLQRETADRCDTLAKIVFVIGLLGSIAAAYFLGNDYSYSSYLGRGYFEYYVSNVPLFRRNGYRQSGTMIP